MQKAQADRMAALIRTQRRGYPDMRVLVRALGKSRWAVVTSFEVYVEVPERVRLSDDPCACSLPGCIDGWLPGHRLNEVRALEKASA